MTPEQFAQFLNYMKENNSWGMNMYELIHERKRRVYKYIDAVWTREIIQFFLSLYVRVAAQRVEASELTRRRKSKHYMILLIVKELTKGVNIY